jgi:hypothetical protein
MSRVSGCMDSLLDHVVGTQARRLDPLVGKWRARDHTHDSVLGPRAHSGRPRSEEE